jgi:hypothetical protein
MSGFLDIGDRRLNWDFLDEWDWWEGKRIEVRFFPLTTRVHTKGQAIFKLLM